MSDVSIDDIYINKNPLSDDSSAESFYSPETSIKGPKYNNKVNIKKKRFSLQRIARDKNNHSFLKTKFGGYCNRDNKSQQNGKVNIFSRIKIGCNRFCVKGRALDIETSSDDGNAAMEIIPNAPLLLHEFSANNSRNDNRIVASLIENKKDTAKSDIWAEENNYIRERGISSGKTGNYKFKPRMPKSMQQSISIHSKSNYEMFKSKQNMI